MNNLPFTPAENAEPARWITEGVRWAGYTVLLTVPAGFEAYARILHPAHVNMYEVPSSVPLGAHVYPSRPVTWAQVAAMTGRTAHRHMQWPHIEGDELPQKFYRPNEGSLSLVTASALWPLLRPHTNTPEHCFFAIWEGYGGLIDEVRRNVPAFETPSRRWYLFYAPIENIEQSFEHYMGGGVVPAQQKSLIEGALDLANNLLLGKRRAPMYARIVDVDPDVDLEGADTTEPSEALRYPKFYQSANFWWPADRAWCVSTEIDLQSTYIGGTRTMIDTIVQSGALEAYEVQPTDDITIESDTINPRPQRTYL